MVWKDQSLVKSGKKCQLQTVLNNLLSIVVPGFLTLKWFFPYKQSSFRDFSANPSDQSVKLTRTGCAWPHRLPSRRPWHLGSFIKRQCLVRVWKPTTQQVEDHENHRDVDSFVFCCSIFPKLAHFKQGLTSNWCFQNFVQRAQST